jgi:hypothetical protein
VVLEVCIFASEGTSLIIIDLMRIAYYPVAILLCTGLAACGNMYVPMPPTAPLVEKQGDLALSGILATGSAFNASAAYALTDRFVALIEYSYNPSIDSGIYQSYTVGGIAVGCMQSAKDLRADFFAGFGRGSSSYEGHGGLYSSGLDSGAASFNSYFLQGSITFENEWRGIGYQLRASYISFDHYLRIDQRYNNSGGVDSDTSRVAEDNLILEHTVFVRIGSEDIKVLGFVNLSNELLTQPQTRWQNILSVGLGAQLRFNLLEAFW